MPAITEYRESELTNEVVHAIAELTAKCFPASNRSLPQRVQSMRDAASSQDHQKIRGRRFVIWKQGLPVAHAHTFVRQIKAENQVVPVLALAAVCSDSALRGQGWGRQVTRRAWQQVGRPGWPQVSLFQTPVPAFYEKLHGRVVNNRFVNRLNDLDPEANPWRDDTIMIYPATFAWPTGTIDLNGPDY